jgi:hypothetical protein
MPAVEPGPLSDCKRYHERPIDMTLATHRIPRAAPGERTCSGGQMRVHSIIAVALGTVTLGWIYEAHAGFKANDPLVVTSSSAKGAAGTVRATADSVQYILCQVEAEVFDGEPFNHVLCIAKTAAGVVRACASGAQPFVQAALSISGDSWIEWEQDENAQCTRLLVENGSHLRPKSL